MGSRPSEGGPARSQVDVSGSDAGDRGAPNLRARLFPRSVRGFSYRRCTSRLTTIAAAPATHQGAPSVKVNTKSGAWKAYTLYPARPTSMPGGATLKP